jgi:hypothetical protein
MQIDVFSLLAEARQRIAAHTAAMEARRDFWLATVNLAAAVVGGGAMAPVAEAPGVMAAPAAQAGH